MKRPLAAIGLIYLATSAAAVCLFPEISFILCVTAAITAIAACFVFREKVRDILIAVSPICIALLVIGCCQVRAEELTAQLTDRSCVIAGEICDMPRRENGRWRYVIQTDSIGIPEARQTIRLLMTSRSSLDGAREGNRISCEVTFLPSDTGSGYNSTTALRADGIDARVWCHTYTGYSVTKGQAGIRYLPQTIRRAIVSGIRKALPRRTSALLCGMLLGDTDYMDDRVIENFRSTGIAHLLAVSGLHLTLLTFALQKLLRKLKCPKRMALSMSIVFILLFMAVTGFPPSVVRAGVMHILALIAQLIFKDPDSLTSLSAAVLIMCLLNPWAAADIGLQLSVCATLGLLLMYDRIYDSLIGAARRWLDRLGKRPQNVRIRRYGKRALRSLAATLAATLAILPLTAVHFGSIPLLSPLTNLLCVYAASVFLTIGILASLLNCLPVIGWLLSMPLRLAASLLCTYLETVTGSLAGLPLAVLNTESGYTVFLCLFVLLLLGISIIIMRKAKDPLFSVHLRRIALCGIAVLVFSAALSDECLCRGSEITVFDAGDGSMCVCAKNRTHAVFADMGGDGYGMSAIQRALHADGIMKVDAAALSEESPARSGNINRLPPQYAPDLIIADSAPAGTKEIPTEPFGSGVQIASVRLRLDTFTDTEGKHWQRLTCGESIALVCPEKGDCMLLPEEWRCCDAAIIGREIFGIAAVRTGAIVVTAKESQADRTCMRLRNMGYRHIYATTMDGTVRFSVKSGKLRIKTEN